jgi:hypothetical protein
MALPKILPLAESVELIELHSLDLEEKAVSLTPVPARPTLPRQSSAASAACASGDASE